MTKLHARNVDPDKMTDEEYYLWLMGIWGDETGQIEPDRWIAGWAKRWHKKAFELQNEYNELLFRYCENDD